MNKIFYIGIGLMGLTIGLYIFDSIGGTLNPETGVMTLHSNYSQVAIYCFMGYFAILVYIFMRWSFRYPQILHIKTFSNGIEEIKPLGHIVDLPGRTSKEIKLQNSPFSNVFLIYFGEGDSKFDYWDCVMQFKDWIAYHGVSMPVIVGNIVETKETESKPAGASAHWKPKVKVIQTFTPTLLSKNYEKFLFGITQDVLQKLNQRLVKQSHLDVDRLEQEAKIIDQQRVETEELNQRLLRLSKEGVSKPYNTVLSLFCRMLDIDQKEINQEMFMKLLNSLRPQDVALQIQNQIADQISRQVAGSIPKLISQAVDTMPKTVFVNTPPVFQSGPLMQNPTRVGGNDGKDQGRIS